MEHGETSQSVSKFHHNHCYVMASCASVASTETWRSELQAITGLTGRQQTQVDSAAFNLMRVFGWGEINTLPSQGRSWEGRGVLCAHMEMQHQLFSKTSPTIHRVPSVHTPSQTRKRPESDRERPVRTTRRLPGKESPGSERRTARLPAWHTTWDQSQGRRTYTASAYNFQNKTYSRCSRAHVTYYVCFGPR